MWDNRGILKHCGEVMEVYDITGVSICYSDDMSRYADADA